MADVDDWGIKVSQEGSDVLTCPDEELVMSSTFNLLKTKLVGLSVGAGNVPHGLAYIPIFFTSIQGSGKGTIIGDDRTTRADTTNITPGATTKYYVFYQSGT